MANYDIKWNFDDNKLEVLNAIDNAVGIFLMEASAEIVSQTARNTAVDTGQLKGSWAAKVDEAKGEAVIGSPLENAIWEEFGTGEFALKGNGRKGGWFYEDAKGDGHFTRGKKPRRAFYKAFTTTKPKIIKRAQEVFKTELDG